MLDSAHRLVLRGVAKGIVTESDGPAVRNLAIAGLIHPVDGVWALTQTGHAVFELEGGDTSVATQAGDLKAKIRDWFMT
jgi:hypothetical protein